MIRLFLFITLGLFLGFYEGQLALAQDNAIECGTHEEITLSIAGSTLGGEMTSSLESVQRFMDACPNITVEFLSTPDVADERLKFFRDLFMIQSDLIDILEIDIVWPGLFAPDLMDLTPYIGQDVLDQHFPAILNALRVDGKLIALPFNTDAGLLYYRADLLAKYDLDVPQTWQDLENHARIMQAGEREAGHDDFWGYVWQGDDYEGLTCNALEWQHAADASQILTGDGLPDVMGAAWIDQLNAAAGWVGSISPPDVLTYTEEEGRMMFQMGNAAFMRNWPYAHSLMSRADSPVAGLFGVAPLPQGESGMSAATLGGWNMGVTAYSRHPEAAVALVVHLTSREEQKIRAITETRNPTIQDLYTDADVLAAQPFFGELYDVFVNAVPRPAAQSGERYELVSFLYFNAVHNVLIGEMSAEVAMSELQDNLTALMQDD